MGEKEKGELNRTKGDSMMEVTREHVFVYKLSIKVLTFFTRRFEENIFSS